MVSECRTTPARNADTQGSTRKLSGGMTRTGMVADTIGSLRVKMTVGEDPRMGVAVALHGDVVAYSQSGSSCRVYLCISG
mmetsp:Transcript_5599/g.6945  ORF Transcript_5599/g.6945 Transcript_5599/m.6945 type:complete len:80 (+) Transcript_5599:461-700(+)